MVKSCALQPNEAFPLTRRKQPACSDLSKLPTKQIIMSAVSQIEKDIKEVSTESGENEEEKRAALHREEEEKKLAEERLEEEKKEWDSA